MRAFFLWLTTRGELGIISVSHNKYVFGVPGVSG